MKLYKKILLLIIIILALISCALKFFSTQETQTLTFNSENDIILWLISNDIDIIDSDFECSNIIIPQTSNKIFNEYKALQKRQNIPIENYLGEEATEYTFRLENNMYAEIIVCNSELAGAMIYDSTNPFVMFPII